MKFFWTAPIFYQKLKTSGKVYVIDTDISKQWNSPQMTHLNHRQTRCIIAVCLTVLLLSPICFGLMLLTDMTSFFGRDWSWAALNQPDDSGSLTVCPGAPVGNTSRQFLVSLDPNSAGENLQVMQRNFKSFSDPGTGNNNVTATWYPSTKVNCSLDDSSSGRRCSDLRTVMRCLSYKFGYKAAIGKPLNPCFLVKMERAKLSNAGNSNSSLKVSSSDCSNGNVCMGCKAKHTKDRSKFSRLRFSRDWDLTGQAQTWPSFLVQVVELQPKANVTLLCWISFWGEWSARHAITIQLVQ